MRNTLFLFLILASINVQALDLTALLPNTISPEFEHLSHIGQHLNTAGGIDYGAEMFNLVAHWDLPKDFYLEIAEGYGLNHRWANPPYSTYGYGELCGPREEFSARLGYKFHIK